MRAELAEQVEALVTQGPLYKTGLKDKKLFFKCG